LPAPAQNAHSATRSFAPSQRALLGIDRGHGRHLGRGSTPALRAIRQRLVAATTTPSIERRTGPDSYTSVTAPLAISCADAERALAVSLVGGIGEALLESRPTVTCDPARREATVGP
jgi:hypothetical protein